MSIGSSIFLHMSDGDFADADQDGVMTLRSGDDGFNTAHIFLPQSDGIRRAAIAAAAINGDWAEVKRLLEATK